MGSFTFIIVATALLAVTGAQNLEGSVTDLQANMTALWAAVAELATCKVPVDIHLHITPGSHEVTVDDEHSDVIPGVMVHTSPDAATSGAADDCSEVTGKRAKKKCKRMNSRRRHHDGSGPARTADAGGPPAPRVGDGWIHAACHMEPNSALQGSEPQIHGHLHLMQTPGEDLMIHMSLSGFGTAAGHRHGFHVHKYGDTHEGCTSAGPHFGHATATHGGPTDAIRHLGDLGNIECDAEGNVRTTLHDSQAKIYGPMSILGRAIVVHAAEDDLGKGGDVGSKSTGNAGSRLACCVIVHTDPTVQGVIPPHHDDDGDYASDSGMAHASHGWFW